MHFTNIRCKDCSTLRRTIYICKSLSSSQDFKLTITNSSKPRSIRSIRPRQQRLRFSSVLEHIQVKQQLPRATKARSSSAATHSMINPSPLIRSFSPTHSRLHKQEGTSKVVLLELLHPMSQFTTFASRTRLATLVLRMLCR